MEKIYLVTGGTGFVGNNVVKALEDQGEIVHALARSEEKTKRALAGAKARVFYGDVRDAASVEQLFCGPEGCEYVFIHTASVVLIGGTKKMYDEMDDVNMRGVKNVIALCKKYNCRLLYVSSVHAITEQPNRGLITEIADFNPAAVVGRYAKSKAAASAEVMRAVRNEGLDAVLVHPSGIVGPGDYSDTHLTQMVADYRAGRIPAATEGGYDFVDVRDVACGIIKAAEKGQTGNCYLLTNTYYSVREMLDTLYQLTGGKKIKSTMPMGLARFSLPWLSLYFKLAKKRPLYTSYSLYTLRSNSNFCHNKATSELDFEPRDLRSSLKDTVDFLMTKSL